MDSDSSITLSAPNSLIHGPSETTKRLIESADLSLHLLASFENFSSSTQDTQHAISTTQSNFPFHSNSDSIEAANPDSIETDKVTALSSSQNDDLMDVLRYSDLAMSNNSQNVDVSVKKDMLHVKATFPDNSVEYVDIHPRFTTINDLKRALCLQRKTKTALGFTSEQAQLLFDNQIVQDDWLVMDCGIHLDGEIRIVKKAMMAETDTLYDPSLSIASIASVYKSHLSNHASQVSICVGKALSEHVRPVEKVFAEMLAGFHATVHEIHDRESYRDGLLFGYVKALKMEMSRLKKVHKGWNFVNGHQNEKTKSVKAAEEMELLQNECNTWQLMLDLECLMEDKGAGWDLELASDIGMTETRALEEMQARDPTFRLLCAVKSWLENIPFDEKQQLIGNQRGLAPRTLQALLNNSYRGLPLEDGVCDSASLDPDAALRDGDAIVVDDDLEDEVSLLKCVWQYIRSGDLNKAIDICVEKGQAWRAASLSGASPVGVDACQPESSDAMDEESICRWGNPSRALYKSMCWKFSEHDASKQLTKRNGKVANEYERLIYGSLSGNIDSMIRSPLCNSWQDHCWAFFQAMTEAQVDEVLLQLVKLKLQSTKLIVGSSPRQLAIFSELVNKSAPLKKYRLHLDLLFDELLESDNERVRVQASQPYHRIQAKLITSQIDFIVDNVLKDSLLHEEFENWDLYLNDTIKADSVPCQFLRFAAHFVLFMGFSDRLKSVQSGFMLVKLYIRHLAKHAQLELIPIYIYMLPDEAVIEMYYQILVPIQSSTEIQSCLRSMLAYLSMPLVSQIIYNVVEGQLQALFPVHKDSDTQTQPSTLTGIDRQRMDVLKLLHHYKEHRAQALFQTNRLAREFVIERNFVALQALFSTYTLEDSIGIIQMHRKEQTFPYPPHFQFENDVLDRILREYLCWCSLTDAFEALYAWRRMILTGDLGSYQAEKDYITDLMYHASRAMTAFTQTVHFENGWMRHCYSPEEETQVNTVRSVCLPMIVFHYHSQMLDATARLQRLKHYPLATKNQLARSLAEKTLEIADHVADEHYQVYRSFSREQCQQLSHRLEATFRQLLFLEE